MPAAPDTLRATKRRHYKTIWPGEQKLFLPTRTSAASSPSRLSRRAIKLEVFKARRSPQSKNRKHARVPGFFGSTGPAHSAADSQDERPRIPTVPPRGPAARSPKLARALAARGADVASRANPPGGKEPRKAAWLAFRSSEGALGRTHAEARAGALYARGARSRTKFRRTGSRN